MPPPFILVENPLTGQRERLYLSEAEYEEYRLIVSEDCSHGRSELRERVTTNGSRQHVRQCLGCGRAVGNPQKRDDGTQLAMWDTGAADLWDAARDEVLRAFLTARFTQQASSDRRFSQEYRDYLLSDEWRSRRERVLERDGHLCQSCRQRPATQVHHLTYEHILDEFLFELVSVYGECHSRLHPAPQLQ